MKSSCFHDFPNAIDRIFCSFLRPFRSPGDMSRIPGDSEIAMSLANLAMLGELLVELLGDMITICDNNDNNDSHTYIYIYI